MAKAYADPHHCLGIYFNATYKHMRKGAGGPAKGKVLAFTYDLLYSLFIQYDPDGEDEEPQPVALSAKKKAEDVRVALAESRMQQLGGRWVMAADSGKQQVGHCACLYLA